MCRDSQKEMFQHKHTHRNKREQKRNKQTDKNMANETGECRIILHFIGIFSNYHTFHRIYWKF